MNGQLPISQQQKQDEAELRRLKLVLAECIENGLRRGAMATLRQIKKIEKRLNGTQKQTTGD